MKDTIINGRRGPEHSSRGGGLVAFGHGKGSFGCNGSKDKVGEFHCRRGDRSVTFD